MASSVITLIKTRSTVFTYKYWYNPLPTFNLIVETFTFSPLGFIPSSLAIDSRIIVNVALVFC